MTNAQFLEAIHVFYNGETNLMVSVQFKRDCGLYEVRRSDTTAVQFMSMNRILEKRGSEQWEFLGVL